MSGLLILLAIVVTSFAAGYGTREVISRQRRSVHLKYRPYLGPSSRASTPSLDDFLRSGGRGR